MFEPRLKLTRNADGTVDLEASVIVPNGCYISDGTLLEGPEDIVLIPETLPLQLLVQKRNGVCTQALVQLTFIRRGIQVSEDKQRLIAFVMLSESNAPKPRIVGTASAALPKTSAQFLAFDATSSGASLGGVSGWINKMPVGPVTVHIVAHMSAPTGGYDYRLEMVGPFGFTGRTLLCNLTATAPERGITIPTDTDVQASGPLEDAKQYDSAAVRFEDVVAFCTLTIAE